MLPTIFSPKQKPKVQICAPKYSKKKEENKRKTKKWSKLDLMENVHFLIYIISVNDLPNKKQILAASLFHFFKVKINSNLLI